VQETVRAASALGAPMGIGAMNKTNARRSVAGFWPRFFCPRPPAAFLIEQSLFHIFVKIA
jgi:hypothetical protein